MEYRLAIEGGPNVIEGGTGLLLFHPSTVKTDQIDTEFFRTDTDAFLVVSTRTTAREVEQKLDFYEVDASKAEILDTLSVERGYSRRSNDHIHYVSAPDDLAGIVEAIRTFLEEHDGKRRISVDSISELTYYAEDEQVVFEAMVEVHDLLAEYNAVGLFHMAPEVHNQETIERYRGQFDGAVHLTQDGTVKVEY